MKQFKLSIEIEKDSPELGNVTSKITDMLFQSISSQLDARYSIEKVKNCISKFKGFDMLTIDLTETEENNYYAKPIIISSWRWVNRYGELKKAKFENNSYTDWSENTSVKEIYSKIKNMTDEVNYLFIETLRKSASIEA